MHVNIWRRFPSCSKLLKKSGLLAFEDATIARKGYIIGRMFGQAAPRTHPHLFNEGEVTPGITKEEYCNRRHMLMEQIAKSSLGQKHQNHIVFIPSSTQAYMSHDVHYPFRQNTNFSYSCGFLEPDSVLIMHSKQDTELPSHKSILFVPRRDPKKELWEGKRSGADGAIELTGVDSADTIDHLERYLHLYLQEFSDFVIWYQYHQPPHPALHLRYIIPFINEDRNSALESLNTVLHQVQLKKSDAEINLIRQTCKIASNAFKEVMAYSHNGIEENHLYAKMDFECRVNGAQQLAYPPVIAGGERALVIHYIRNDQKVDSDEMVLMDAGCDYHGYASDITRTWPVSGHFTKAQKEVYEAVLRVQEACLKCCAQENISLSMMYQYMLELQIDELKRLGVIRNKNISGDLLQIARQYCPHHLGHYLGMDVHDTDSICRSTKLEPGMVFTIEPGFYFPAHMRDVPAKYRGIGVRIEDDVLKTENGYENLTKCCPKTVEDIENTINRPKFV